MPPKKRGRGRGGTRGRGRGVSRKRGSMRRPLSLSGAMTAEDTDAEGTSNSCNVSLKQSLSRKKNSMEYNEERELSLPRLKSTVIPENATLLSMLSRDKKCKYIMTDDELDRVQWDLESLLTSLIIRKHTVREELKTFAKTMQFPRSQHRTSKNPKFPTIRPRAAAEISPVNECRKLKVEFDPLSKELPPSKTESANKFWSMVEPFLARAKKDDLNWLEDLVKSYRDDKKLYEIPPLGEHYAKRWAQEELEIQKNQSSCSPRLSKRLKLAERLSPDVVELVNKLNLVAHEGSVYVPLYRKILTSINDYSHLSGDEVEEHFQDFDDVEDKPQEMSSVCKEFYAEQNIKKQLYKLGLMGRYAKPVLSPVGLPSSLSTFDEEYDEVLEEIRKCDNSLSQLRELNKDHLTQLLGKCRLDYCQKTLRNQLEKVNNEILQFKRQQNESLSKEKQSAQITREDKELRFLLDQRCSYIKQLKSMGFESLGYLTPCVSDDSESSEEGSDPSKLLIKLELPEHNISVKQDEKTNDVYQTEDHIATKIDMNIKQEIEDEKMDCEESHDVKDVMEIDFNEQAIEEVVSEKILKTEFEKNDESENSRDNDNASDQDDKSITKTNTKTNFKVKQVDKTKDLDNSTVKPMRTRRRGKPKKNTSDNEQTSKTESRKMFKIKQESESELEIDPSEDTIDGIKRELRPRKLNEGTIYFKPYDGSTSEDSDFTDMTD